MTIIITMIRVKTNAAYETRGHQANAAGIPMIKTVMQVRSGDRKQEGREIPSYHTHNVLPRRRERPWTGESRGWSGLIWHSGECSLYIASEKPCWETRAWASRFSSLSPFWCSIFRCFFLFLRWFTFFLLFGLWFSVLFCVFWIVCDGLFTSFILKSYLEMFPNTWTIEPPWLQSIDSSFSPSRT